MINLNHIQFGYRPKQTVLKDLTLQIAPGHIYGLLGRNGVGKTSLMHLLSGLVFPQSGDCSVRGFEPRKRKVEFLQGLYLLPDEVHFPAISVSNYLNIYTPFYPQFDHAMFHSMLAEFGITTDVYPQKLSLGQRKQIAICFALATQAKILLLDEPTNGLDIPAKKIFRKIVAGALQDDQLMIISTQQVKDLESLIDHVLVLDDQELILDMSIEDITDRFAFKLVNNLDEVLIPIYHEKALKGSAVIALNTADEHTRFDMELFFNALLNEKQQVLSYLKGQK